MRIRQGLGNLARLQALAKLGQLAGGTTAAHQLIAWGAMLLRCTATTIMLLPGAAGWKGETYKPHDNVTTGNEEVSHWRGGGGGS